MSPWLEKLGEQAWLFEALLYAVFTITLFIFWNRAQHKVLQHADKSKSPWDDVFIRALGAPVSLLIIALGGLQVITASLQLITTLVVTDHKKISEAVQNINSIIIFITFFWIVLRIINGVELKYRRKKLTIGEKQLASGTLYAIFQTLRAAIFIVAVLMAMEAAGLSVSSLLAFGGIGGVIIGFAAKDSLANFFSGLLIFWERPFVIGDWIRRPDANIEGVVENIGWRMTQIRTFDQRPLYVPNSLFFNSVIENPQRMTHRRIYEYMGLRYEDIEKVPAVLKDIHTMLDLHQEVAQDQIKMVNFDRYGASSLDFFIYVMTRTTNWKRYHEIKEDILLKIAEIVIKHGCEFAYPTRTIHHHVDNVKTSPSLPA